MSRSILTLVGSSRIKKNYCRIEIARTWLPVKLWSNFGDLGEQCFSVVILEDDGDQHDLELGDSGRQDESLVIAVDHDHGPNASGRESP